MDEPNLPQLPFPTRDMLRFGRSNKIALKVSVQAQTTTTLTLRLVTREGISEYKIPYTLFGLQQDFTFDVSDIPIYASITSEAADIRQGAAFATLSLLIAGSVVSQMCSGYVYRQKGISWPTSNSDDVLPGRGGIFTLAATLAGAEEAAEWAIPSGQLWRIISVDFTFVSGGTAGNRFPRVVFDTGDNGYIEAFSNTAQTASLTRHYSAAHFGYTPSELNTTHQLINIPKEIWCFPGGTITITNPDLDAADEFTQGKLIYELLYSNIV